MALNPPIQALPTQQADRDGHLQRFLTSLPDFGSSSWAAGQGEGSGQRELLYIHSYRVADKLAEDQASPEGSTQMHDREAEAAERKLTPILATDQAELQIGRLQRKTRRREQAAILKAKPSPPPAEPQSSAQKEKEELDQEWWDQYRAQKQGTHHQNHNHMKTKKKRSASTDEEIEKADRIMERKENRQMQTRIPRAKTKGKKGGIPGLEIIDGYRPMTTALGPRMTVRISLLPLIFFSSVIQGR
jgi:hypothetical protein